MQEKTVKVYKMQSHVRLHSNGKYVMSIDIDEPVQDIINVLLEFQNSRSDVNE